MKIRLGFVSNSSSSSFMTHFNVSLPDLPKSDEELSKLVFGDTMPLCKIRRESFDYDFDKNMPVLPLDKESAIKEVRDILSRAMRLKDVQGEDKIELQRTLMKDVVKLKTIEEKWYRRIKSNYDRWTTFQTEKREKGEDIDITQFFTQEELDCLDNPKQDKCFPLMGLSNSEAYEYMDKKIDFSRVYHIQDKHEINDNWYSGRKNTILEKDDKKFVNGKNASLQCLFKHIDDGKKFNVEWTTESDQNTPDNDWKTEYDIDGTEFDRKTFNQNNMKKKLETAIQNISHVKTCDDIKDMSSAVISNLQMILESNVYDLEYDEINDMYYDDKELPNPMKKDLETFVLKPSKMLLDKMNELC